MQNIAPSQKYSYNMPILGRNIAWTCLLCMLIQAMYCRWSGITPQLFWYGVVVVPILALDVLGWERHALPKRSKWILW